MLKITEQILHWDIPQKCQPSLDRRLLRRSWCFHCGAPGVRGGVPKNCFYMWLDPRSSLSCFIHFCFKMTANGNGACVILVFPVVDNSFLFAGELNTSKLYSRLVRKRNSSAFATCCPIHCRGPILNARKFLIFDAGKRAPSSSRNLSGLNSIGSLK